MKTTRIIVGACAVTVLTCSSGRGQWVQWETSAGGNGHWYEAVAVTNGISWRQASELAHSECGYLATLTSAAENDFVFSLVNSPQFFTAQNGSGPALGGFQMPGSPEPDCGWTWITGEPWSYTHWGPGLPDGAAEDRLHFFSGLSSTPSSNWNDIYSEDLNLGGYVVERETGPDQICATIYTAVEVCWNTQTNKTYQVQWVDSLATTNWNDWGTPIQATNTTTCVFDSARGGQRRFYRIQLLP